MRVDVPRGLPDAVVVGAYNGRVNIPRQPQRFVITKDQSSPSTLYPDSRSQRKFLTIDRGRRDAPAVITVTTQESLPKLMQAQQKIAASDMDTAQSLTPVKALEHNNAEELEPLLPATGEVHTVVPAALAEGGAGKGGDGPGKTAKDFGAEGEYEGEWDIDLGDTRGKLSKDKKTALFKPSPDITADNATSTENREIIEVPVATSPRTFFDPTAENQLGRISVDLGLIQRKLLELGFDEWTASSFAVVFQDSPTINVKHLEANGSYHPSGLLAETATDTTYYPMAVALVSRNDVAGMNFSFWHEMGHGHHDKVKGITSRASWNATPRIINRTRNVGLATEISGTLLSAGSALTSTLSNVNIELGVGGLLAGAAVVTVGAALRYTPAWALRRLDPFERYADRFARQMSHLQAIYIED